MPHRLLVVDDDPFFRRIVQGIFTPPDYQVTEAVDGVDGLEKVNADPPEVILLDIVMPVLDGYQVFQALKDHPTANTIPVIFVTGKTEDEVNRLAYRAAAFACIPKPVRWEALLATVELALLQAGRRTTHPA
ncbi:MAG TPA: response regulator [Candidatus Sulfotelmatobacter sp.]|nr:response regulator [Candidatus Sulfotelmatobacter sp.]